MAGAGIPELELHPLGEEVSQDSSISKQSLLDPPSQTTTASGLAGEPDITRQEKPKTVGSEDCKENSAMPSSREIRDSCLKVSEEPGEKDQDSSGNFVLSGASNHNLAKTLTGSYQHNTAVNAICENPQDSRTLQSINQGSLPVQRSHSDTLSKVKEVAPHPAADSEACGVTCHLGNHFNHEAHVCSVLSCRQPSQQCNIITTFSSSGQGGAPQPQSRRVCAETPAQVEGIKDKGQSYAKCDNALCCGSYVSNVNFEDTFAAYCHPQPIPAPSQLLPRLAGAEASCDIQRAVEPPSAINHLTLPRLISSVSETGLNAKHLLRCCSLNCSWVSNLPPGAGPQSQKHFGLEECCSSQAGAFRTTTREMGTMTAHKELRDVGVQAGPTTTPHVFPEVCLAEESRDEICHSQSLNTDSNGDKKASGAPKSPVKEVKWDAEGMTWEVYGASVDPEELGIAIQRHLELQIRETANRAAKLSRQNTNTSRQSGNNSCQRKKSRLMGSFRTPACCARTTTAVD